MMECSPPAAKTRIHLVDMLVNDPKSSAYLSLLRWNKNDSYRFKAQFYNTKMMSSLRVVFLCLFFLCLFISPSSLFLLTPVLLKPYLRSSSLKEGHVHRYAGKLLAVFTGQAIWNLPYHHQSKGLIAT